jgi:hypothetical protein
MRPSHVRDTIVDLIKCQLLANSRSTVFLENDTDGMVSIPRITQHFLIFLTIPRPCGCVMADPSVHLSADLAQGRSTDLPG